MIFKSLEVSEYHRLKHYFDGQPYEMCAYSLPSILSWRSDAFEPRFIEYQDMLLIKAHFFEAEKKWGWR